MPQAKRNARGERTEKELLRVAVDQVRRYGYDKTTIASVARAAGKPASSVYWLFADKDELITRALEASYPAQTLASQWELFQPERTVREQLVENFTGLLTKTDRQDSVRTGIMLAMEGAAADLPVQGPFWNRRGRTFARFNEWWVDALAVLWADNSIAVGDNVAEAARRMSALTMWNLDGHYVGDRDDTGELASVKAEAVADQLIAAAQSEFVTRTNVEREPDQAEIAEREIDEPDAELLAVTRELIAAHGYEGATIARICDASGLKRSSVYWRHKDKDALVKAAVAEQFLDVMGRIDHLPSAGTVSRDEVVAVLGVELAQVPVRAGIDPALNKAGLLVAVQRFDPPTAAGLTMIETTRGIVARLEQWLGQAVGLGEQDAHVMAWMFTRLRMGMLVGHVLDGHEVPFDAAMAADALRLFLSRNG